MRRFLLVMGILFTGLLGVGLGLLGTVGVLASHSSETNTERAVELVTDFSQTWSIDDAASSFTRSARAQASSRSGRHALHTMSRLGALQSINDPRQTAYNIDLDVGTTVTVQFKGQFEHGTADVTVFLRYVNDDAKIVELDMKKIRLRIQRQRRAAV